MYAYKYRNTIYLSHSSGVHLSNPFNFNTEFFMPQHNCSMNYSCSFFNGSCQSLRSIRLLISHTQRSLGLPGSSRVKLLLWELSLP